MGRRRRNLYARTAAFAVALVALIAVAAGCGSSDSNGSGDSGSTTTVAVKTSSLTKAEFLKRAQAACQAAREDLLNQAISYLNKHESGKQTPAEQSVVIANMAHAVILPVVHTEIATIRKLGAPAGDEEEIGAFLGAEQEDAAQLAAAKSLRSTVTIERYFAPSGKLARAYGLAECANG